MKRLLIALLASATVFPFTLYSQCNFTITHNNNNDHCLYAIEEVVWKNLVNSTALAPGNSLTATGTNNEVFDAGALSVNEIKNNGWATVRINETNTEKIFGLSNSPSVTPGFSRAQFGIYFINDGTFRIYESGNYRSGGDGSYAINDIFKIAVELNTVKYFKNGSLFYTSAVTPVLPLTVDATLKRKNTATPVATLHDVTVYNGSDGVFKALATSAGSGASYQWFLNAAPVGTNSSTYTNTTLSSTDILTCQITIGTGGCTTSGTVLTSNAIKFTSRSASSFGTYYATSVPATTACLEAQENAVFTNLINSSASGNNVTKTQGLNGSNDASAFSLNNVGNNGYAETTIAEVPTNRAFGLSASNAGVAYTTIQYAFLIRGDGTLDIYESGSFRYGNVSSYTTGTKLKIAVDENVVKYYVNGSLKYVSTVTPSLPLFVDLSFTSSNATLSDIIIVNGTTGSFTAGGSPLSSSATYTWNINGVTSPITASNYSNTSLNTGDQVVVQVNPGLVGCNAVPAQTFDLRAASSFKGTFYITASSAPAACAETIEDVIFTNVVNAVTSGNDIQKFGDNITETYNGGAVSLNQVYNNGYAETTIRQLGATRAFGLSANNSDPSKTSIQYGIEFRGDNMLQIFEGTSARTALFSFALNDVLRVSVESNVVKYYKNGTLLYTSSVTPSLPLVVDVSLYSRLPQSRIDDVVVSNGSSAVFTTVSTGAGASPSFQWKLNGANAGTGSTYSNSTLSTNDIISCTMRPDLAGCSTTDYAANNITMKTVGGLSSPTTTWTGATSTDWFSSSNWSNGIPRGYYKVTIPVTARNPQITTSSTQPAAYDITINSGAQLTITGTNSLIIFNNWTNNGTFSSGSSAITLQTCTNNKNTVITSLPQAFHSLEVKNSNGADFSGEHHIKGQMTFTTGIVNYNTASSLIVFDDNATVTGASSTSHINGKVRKDGNDPFIFPIGKSAIFRPVTITAPSTSDSYNAEYFFASSSAIGIAMDATFWTVSGCEYWLLQPSGSSSVQATLPWNTSDCVSPYITDLSQLTLASWNGSKWIDAGTSSISGPVNNGLLTSASLSNGTYYTFGSYTSQNPLPIELMDFDAISTSSGVALTWTTYTETNSYAFEIERASADMNFETIGSVPAKGTTKESNKYKFFDQAPLPGRNYYRLKLVDIDGLFTYTDIVATQYKTDGEVRLFPNPVLRGEPITLTGAKTITVIDQLKMSVLIKSTKNYIETRDLKPGVYIAVDENHQHHRFVVR